MAEHEPLYRHSRDEAQRLGELDGWYASRHENIACRDYISQSVNLGYDGTRLSGDVAEQAIAKFGYDRVNWILANTIQLKDHDGRISAENKAWAKGFYMGEDARERWVYSIVGNNPGLVDLAANQARRAYEQLNLFSAQQCDSVYDFEDVTGHVLVLKPEVLKDEYKTPESQLFLARHGFGCRPTASGRSIFGEFLIDGEQARYLRHEFLGVLKPEHLPAWAIEKMADPEPESEQKPMHIKMFQINTGRDTEQRCFEPFEPGQAVDPSAYDEVFSGEVDCADLEAVFHRFHTRPPAEHRGREMDVSDVVQVLRCDTEIYGKIRYYIAPELFEECTYFSREKFERALDEARDVGACIEVERLAGQHVPGAEPGFYFCGKEDFKQIEFDAGQTQAAAEDAGMEEAQGDMGMTFHGM